jgi:YrbI family 3-deoxy-D-manno-octulosonate 8-phosphate phosphatase
MIKVFATDVDGVLTDAGMYYSESGDEFKKFSTYDGKAFEILKKLGVKTAIITSEDTKIVANRAKKLSVDYLYQGVNNKLDILNKICKAESVNYNEVSYIGDDINDLEVLDRVKHKACPMNAMEEVKGINEIIQLNAQGGYGAVREFVNLLIEQGFISEK